MIYAIDNNNCYYTESNSGVGKCKDRDEPTPVEPTLESRAVYGEISGEDHLLLERLTVDVADNGFIWCMRNALALRKQTQDLEERVHYLKILEVSVTDVKISIKLLKISQDKQKWNRFIRGLDKKLSSIPEIEKFAQTFALATGAPPEKILKYFREKDWAGLLEFLLAPIQPKN